MMKYERVPWRFPALSRNTWETRGSHTPCLCACSVRVDRPRWTKNNWASWKNSMEPMKESVTNKCAYQACPNRCPGTSLPSGNGPDAVMPDDSSCGRRNAVGMGTPSFKRQTTGVLNALKMQRRLKFISQDSENLERAIQRRSSAGRAGRSWCGRAAAGSSSADGAGRGSGKGNRHSKKRLGMLDALGHGRGLAHSAASARLIVSDLRELIQTDARR